MANDLNEDLTGRYVVLREESMYDEFKPLHWRIVHATGGFGCNPELMGHAVFGENVADGEKARWEQVGFERFATDDEVAIAYAFRLEREAETV